MNVWEIEQKIKVNKDYLEKIVKNKSYNDVIVKYYKQMELENIKIPKSKIESVECCNSYLHLDVYLEQRRKDFLKTCLCRDRFCSNCKKVVQAARMERFLKPIEKVVNENKYSVYHLTLTQPNVSGKELRQSLDMMIKSFSILNRYLKGDKKIKGMDLSFLNYRGAIRSFEITYNNDSYHPHFHVLIVTENPLILKKEHINTYSYDAYTNTLKNYFSTEEIIIQKLWYLLMNRISITKENIQNLNLGYSCIINKFKNDDYKELFKYLIKEVSEDGNVFTYENFKTLYLSTYRLKEMQGYGCFYDMDFDDIDIELVDSIYNKYIEELRKKEDPEFTYETPESLIKDNDFLLISRKKIYQYLRELNNK